MVWGIQSDDDVRCISFIMFYFFKKLYKMPTMNRLEIIASDLIRRSEALGYEMKGDVILKARDELFDILSK